MNMSLKTPKKQSGGLEVENTSRGRRRGGGEAAAGGVAAEIICIRSCTASNVPNDDCFSPFLKSYDLFIAK
jgi:hypothetical protein